MRLLFVLGLFLLAEKAEAVRIKDLARIRGVKENQLVGYGVVVGLPGSGDRNTDLAEASLQNALKGLGVDSKIPKIGTRNSAVVLVTATLPPFTRVGTQLDVTVASIGSATSLEGGTLVTTPLKAADGAVYAVAQGRIPVVKKTERGSIAYQALLTVQIPSGALLEKDVDFDFSELKSLKYQLYSPDFTTAARMAHKINEELAGKYATAADPGTVDVILPYGLGETPVELVAKLEGLDVEPDRVAKVVMSRKTGTVVLGEHVRVTPVAIAHGNLRIWIRDEKREPNEEKVETEPVNPLVPAPIAGPAQSSLKPRQVTFINRSTSIADVLTSLNEVGASPDDMVFVLQSLKASGALIAELDLR